jgi:hypothetical protein
LESGIGNSTYGQPGSGDERPKRRCPSKRKRDKAKSLRFKKTVVPYNPDEKERQADSDSNVLENTVLDLRQRLVERKRDKTEAFLKKKKEDKEEGEGDEEDAAEGEKEKDEGADDDKDPGEDKKDGEAEEEDKEKKPTRIINSIKNIKSQVHVPAFLSKKASAKDKDVEAGDKEEAKELLEKKDGDDKGEGDDNKEKPEEDDAEDKKEEGEEKTTCQTKNHGFWNA